MQIKGTNLAMIRGDSENISISIKKDDEPYLSDGDVLFFTVKRSVHTEEKIIQKIISNFPYDKVVIEIEPEDTKHLPYGTYKYDIQIIKLNGMVKTIIGPSNFKILSEVTYE